MSVPTLDRRIGGPADTRPLSPARKTLKPSGVSRHCAPLTTYQASAPECTCTGVLIFAGNTPAFAHECRRRLNETRRRGSASLLVGEPASAIVPGVSKGVPAASGQPGHDDSEVADGLTVRPARCRRRHPLRSPDQHPSGQAAAPSSARRGGALWSRRGVLSRTRWHASDTRRLRCRESARWRPGHSNRTASANDR